MAAKMLHDLELRGKVVTAGNVTYYIALHLREWPQELRLREDRCHVLLHPARWESLHVLSMETEVGLGPRDEWNPFSLGEFLSCSQDDPSKTAARNLDWELFLASHDYRYGIILKDIVHDKTALEEARDMGVRYHKARELRFRIGR